MPDEEIQHPLEQPAADRLPDLDPEDLDELDRVTPLPADEPVPEPPA